jgi:hypothetical protein
MIREAVVIGVIIYILINIAQVLDRPAVAIEGVVIIASLVCAAILYYYRNEEILRKWEGAALWAAVLLFLVYGALKFGGAI